MKETSAAAKEHSEVTQRIKHEKAPASRSPAGAATGHRGHKKGRPVPIKVACVLDFVAGVLAMITGLYMSPSDRQVPFYLVVLILIFGVFCLILGVRILDGYAWARWVQMILFVPLVFASLWFIPFALLVFALMIRPSVADFCER